MRHSWMACQSINVRALKNTLTVKAPTIQKMPTTKAVTAGVVRPRRSPREVSSARPGISKDRVAFSPGRLAPQAWQYRELTINSEPQRQVALRSGYAMTSDADIGGRQKSCPAWFAASAIRKSFPPHFRIASRLPKQPYCKHAYLRRNQGKGGRAAEQELRIRVRIFHCALTEGVTNVPGLIPGGGFQVKYAGKTLPGGGHEESKLFCLEPVLGRPLPIVATRVRKNGPSPRSKRSDF